MNFKPSQYTQKSAYESMLEDLGIFQEFPVEKEEEIPSSPESTEYEYTEYDSGGLSFEMTGKGGPQFCLEYDDVIFASQKKIHRYSRKDRLKFTVCQLAGISGDVPERLIDLIRHKLKTRNPNKIWNGVRKLLKKGKFRRYYNRIPHIIKQITGLRIIGFDTGVLPRIENRFTELMIKFDTHFKEKWQRQYFLNMRFLCLKLIFEQGCLYPYYIPLIRTNRKRKYLDLLFNEMNNY